MLGSRRDRFSGVGFAVPSSRSPPATRPPPSTALHWSPRRPTTARCCRVGAWVGHSQHYGYSFCIRCRDARGGPRDYGQLAGRSSPTVDAVTVAQRDEANHGAKGRVTITVLNWKTRFDATTYKIHGG